ncbi:helix-turn-helix domain-containing protein [Asticcacaulis taihuensis]|uniref:Transcriptional regulator, contains XRE-family HTH domain n=1 Tax=Asticcacaulis taihuensis TaxID=260084 RepID=A0A1G4T2T7_9CAUL|nr:helix-turn-helix transcriptional regulator [Asticcacaulis taihuensis]MCR6659066.1 helix-turn-helix domain-containing protein [Asticcacaulis sp.]SCW75135.1 Transcriptional regulator, contains XRE-family HTH domain [Asticcacaulis taihuensis]
MDDNLKAERGPNPVDLHVGARVRMRRKFLGMSQEGLAETIALTFQQVQKYERGSNRISASKLWEIAKALKAPVAYFFEGYGENEAVEGFSESESEQFVHGFLMTTEGIELAEAFPRIKNAKHRRRILELVRSLAEDDDA